MGHIAHIRYGFNGRSIFHGIKFYSFNTPVYVLYHLKNYRPCLFSLRNFHYMLGTRSWCRCDKLLKENLLINATNYLFICTIQYKEKRRFVNNLNLWWIDPTRCQATVKVATRGYFCFVLQYWELILVLCIN